MLLIFSGQEFSDSLFKQFPVSKLTFPDNLHAPAVPPQPRDASQIAAPILCELRKPEIELRLWEPRKRATRMPVEKTSVDKDDLAVTWKNEVGFAWEAGTVQPESVSTGMGDSPYQKFGLCVLASDERHALAALWLGKRVHGSS
jgi:hypothetical protein